MRLGKSRRARPVSVVLVLVLSLLGFLPQLAHASTYVGYSSANQTGACGGGSSHCIGLEPGAQGFQAFGITLQSPLQGQIISVTFVPGRATTEELPNQLVVLTSASTPTTTSFTCLFQGNGVCPSTATGNSFTVKDVEGISGLTPNVFNTVTLANPVTANNGQWVSALVMDTQGSQNALVWGCSASCPVSNTQDNEINFGTQSPVTGNSYTSTTANQNGYGLLFGMTFSATGSTTTTATQCYGNCGSPAITLANTNSTHAFNFNQSITFFYEFQSNLNGFILNVTTNIAKNYNNGMDLGIAVYEVTGACQPGQTPFTVACPGLRMFGANNFQGTLAKGRFSALPGSAGQIPVSNGQWVAIAISASASGLDLNDTNTVVPLFITSGGLPMQPSITQSSASTCACKMGLWAFILGNVVSSQTPTTPSAATCLGGIDCILTQITNSACSVLTTQCQTGMGIMWVIILTIITLTVLIYSFSNILPGVNLGRVGLGEIGILIFLGWLSIFTSISLIAPWFIILVFFAVAWMFIGKAKGSGPI